MTEKGDGGNTINNENPCTDVNTTRAPRIFRSRESGWRVQECVWNGSLLYVGAAGALKQQWDQPVVQLMRLCHVLLFLNICVFIRVGHHHFRVFVWRVRWHRFRQPGPHVDGRSVVRLFCRHDRHQKHLVPSSASCHRHGHPPTDRSKIIVYFLIYILFLIFAQIIVYIGISFLGHQISTSTIDRCSTTVFVANSYS